MQVFRITNEERLGIRLAADFLIPTLRPATEGPIYVQGEW